MILNAINDKGNAFALLAPFFEALLPAFEAGADEIRIEPASQGLKLTYDGKSLFVPLADSELNYAGVAFSRVLILSRMSIALEGAEQTGTFKAKCNQQLIEIHVTSWRDAGTWFLIFRPNTVPRP